MPLPDGLLFLWCREKVTKRDCGLKSHPMISASAGPIHGPWGSVNKPSPMGKGDREAVDEVAVCYYED